MITAMAMPSLVRVAKPSTATVAANQEVVATLPMAAAEQHGKVTTLHQVAMVVHQEAGLAALHPALAVVLQMLAKMTPSALCSDGSTAHIGRF
jgi:hypothetical protein